MKNLIAAVFCLATLSLAQTSKPLIAINNLEGRGISADEASTLSDVLRNELINTGRYRVMERSQMEDILKEQGFQQSGACSNDRCMIEMGQLLGAEQMVSGSVGKIGKAYSINIRMFLISTGEIIANVSQNYNGPIEGLLNTEIPYVAKRIGEFQDKISAKNVDQRSAGASETYSTPSQLAAQQTSKSTQKKASGSEQSTQTTMQSAQRNNTFPWLPVIGVSTLAIGGGAAAVLFLAKKESTGNSNIPTTDVTISW